MGNDNEVRNECVFCGSTEDLLPFKDKFICKNDATGVSGLETKPKPKKRTKGKKLEDLSDIEQPAQ